MSVEDRRAALIESAYRVIADHGVEGATTRRICAHAGMPLASFHYAFESRMALLCAVMDTAVPTDLHDMLRSLIAEATEPPAAARGFDAMNRDMRKQLYLFYDVLKADPGRLQATISLGIYAHNHHELQEKGREMYNRLYEVAGEGLTFAAQHADVRWREPVETISPLLIAGTNAITLTYLSTADEEVVHNIIEAVADQLMSYVARD